MPPLEDESKLAAMQFVKLHLLKAFFSAWKGSLDRPLHFPEPVGDPGVTFIIEGVAVRPKRRRLSFIERRLEIQRELQLPLWALHTGQSPIGPPGGRSV